jgi:hypothetical protein
MNMELTTTNCVRLYLAYPDDPWVETRLELQRFVEQDLKQILEPYLAGYTLYHGKGLWENEEDHVFVVEYYDVASIDDISDAIEGISNAWCKIYDQKCIGVSVTPSVMWGTV